MDCLISELSIYHKNKTKQNYSKELTTIYCKYSFCLPVASVGPMNKHVFEAYYICTSYRPLSD